MKKVREVLGMMLAGCLLINHGAGALAADYTSNTVIVNQQVTIKVRPTAQPPGETAPPNGTAAPEASQSPETTPAPEQSISPQESAAPDVTESAGQTAAPSDTEQPEQQPSPQVTDEPVQTPEPTQAPEQTAAPDATDDPEVTLPPEPTTTPEPIPTPNATAGPCEGLYFTRDSEGNILLNESGDPIVMTDGSTPLPLGWEKDEGGQLVLDENGLPIPIWESEEEQQPVITYQRDPSGALVLDENGNPIANVPEGMEIPVSYQRDENGQLVLDENGDPIPQYTLPEGATQIGSLADQLNPDRRIEMYLVTPADELFFGGEATMRALLYGYENAVCTVRWQQSTDNAAWVDVEGGDGEELTIIVDETNYQNFWRVVVTITDVIDPTVSEVK